MQVTVCHPESRDAGANDTQMGADLLSGCWPSNPLHRADPVSACVWGGGVGGDSVLEEGDGKTFPSIPGAAGNVSERLSQQLPASALLSMAEHADLSQCIPAQPPAAAPAGVGAGGRRGGVTADKPPRPLPPSLLPSQPSPSQRSSHTY